MTTRPNGCCRSPNVHRGVSNEQGQPHNEAMISDVDKNISMKRCLAKFGVLCILIPGIQSALCGGEAGVEQQLIAVLRSDRSPQEKDAACAKLKRVGTARSVPALTALLWDEQLSHSARYVLESMPGDEAEQALIGALDKTEGLTKVGLIASLGVRGEEQAVPMLAKLLADSDIQVASAAALSLGKIAGPEALKALEVSLATSTDPVHGAVVDAVLASANRLLVLGDRANALVIFSRLYDTEKKDSVRQAAFRGMICASGKRAVNLMTTAIAGGDGVRQAAALQLVHEIDDPTATASLVKLLPKVNPVVQAALIEGLAHRGHVSAGPAVAALAASDDPVVRLSAVKAVGILGDASAVPMLAKMAASSSGDIQKAARQSLVQLHRGNVTDALLAQVASAKPAVQAELVRAIGERADTGTLPRLFELAQRGPEAPRTAAYRALGMLAGAAQMDPMVRLVMEAKGDAARTEAGAALGSMCQRLQSRRADLDVGAIVKGIETGNPETRVVLLRVCSGLFHPAIRDVLRRESSDADRRIREAACRAMCETRDMELLPDLVKMASTDGEANVRVLAIRGGMRLTAQDASGKLSVRQRLDALKALLDCATRVEEKRLILSGLAGIPDPDALGLTVPLLDNADVQNEAAQAATKIAGTMAATQSAAVSAAMKKVLAVSSDGAVRQAADAVLKQIDAMTGFVTAWQVAGPYQENRKDYAALFEIAFDPERPDPQGVTWRPLPAGTDAARPWLIDLLKALGGEQCVAYARTRVYSETEQAAILELGSDDGVKVWLNGIQVYANNTARPLTRGSDKVTVTLRLGWNVLLLKVTQNNLGWEFCARLVKPDGSALEGLRFDAQAE